VTKVGALVFPAASLAVAVTSPLVWTVGDSTFQLPSASVVAVLLLPSGQVTVMVDPGSAEPLALILPLSSGSYHQRCRGKRW